MILDYHLTIINEHFIIISLKLTIIRSFDHHWEAAPTGESVSEQTEGRYSSFHFIWNFKTIMNVSAKK